MRLFVATDVTVFQQGDVVYAQEKHATIFKRYHDAFGKIALCARVEKINTVAKGFVDITQIVDDMIVIGSLSKMLLGKYKAQMKREMQKCDLVIARCPSLAAYRAADYARALHIPYLAESMGCAWDAYWNHGLSGKLVAPYMFFKMKQVAKNADYALYVTEKFLQKRYPCKKESVAASNVLIREISDQVLDARLSHMREGAINTVTLMTTAAVDVRYKGQEYVIRTIPELNKRGIRVRYNVVGEGSPAYLRALAEKCGVAEQVCFVGRIPLQEVFELLDEADLYIQPSLQEGLPRSVIEAMSRGCACIGAKTAGIPELLEDAFVVRRKSVADIVAVIQSYCAAPRDERCRISKRNFDEAKKYAADVLNKPRNDYFAKIASELGEEG